MMGKSTKRDLESGEIISRLASIPVDLRPKNINQVVLMQITALFGDLLAHFTTPSL